VQHKYIYNVGIRRQVNELSNWIYSDWMEIHSKNSFHGPVADRRWQNFTTTALTVFIINNTHTQCFSTYSDNSNLNLTFFTEELEHQTTINVGHDDDDVEQKNFPFQWFQYAITAKSNHFNISIDNITENIKIDFVPYAIAINNNNNLKFHNCKNLFIMFVTVNLHVFINLKTC
jgi:hypothetical protein